MNTAYLNVLTIGKSGVGKSSLVNYLFDTTRCKTGSGEPQTKELFQTISYNFSKDLVLRLTDTKGLEPNEYEKWLKDITQNITEKERDGIREQYHAILYCINAGADRIEDAEIRIVSELSELFPIGIVLTHCIKGKKKESIQGIRKALVDAGIKENNIFEVCNINGKLISGEVLEQFGKDELLKYISSCFSKKICTGLPHDLEVIVDEQIEDYKSDCYIVIDNEIKINNFRSNKNKKVIEEKIQRLIQMCHDSIDEKFVAEENEIFQMYETIYNSFFSPANMALDEELEIPLFLQQNFKDVMTENLTAAIIAFIPAAVFFLPHMLTEMHRGECKKKVDEAFVSLKEYELEKIEKICELFN